jgi:hypothetical protein
LLFSLTFFSALLRWTEWSSRYQLPFFVVGAPLVGFMLDRYLSKKIATLIGILMLLFAIPFAISNRTRSLIPWSRVESVYHPRVYQYFLDSHTAIAAANIAAADFVNQLPCDQIAIDPYLEHPVLALTPRSMYLYPMLAQIHANGGRRNVWYTGVQNDTIRYTNTRKPCAVVCVECARVPGKWEAYRSVGGRASLFDYIVVFSKQGTIDNSGEAQAPTGADNGARKK